ncbi:glycoside hydrolase family 57 protein [Marinobacter sp. HL-58]|uniref:glycoside hydrolase family 57 protein n=1 Tax=Marinobacter sp. HL-58 TaxID=1479237 RepID=UPI0004836B6D|nr:glycoside hydrolase family 57 protein [Marinobacter sp. HL-58]KPP98881.1 MAG: Alpha-amylase/alpha-mannosidase [Marinobacter sp. HL-58]
MSDKPLRLVLCWHMHQPDYCDPASGQYLSPWVYLHAIKDYTDMASHLEEAPEGTKVAVNFPPVLLEQIRDYGGRLQSFLDNGTAIGGPLLDALITEQLPQDQQQRHDLLTRCLQAHQARMIEPLPAFDRLVIMTRAALETGPGPRYLSDTQLADLLVWYHLAWTGETVRRQEPLVAELMEQESDYSLENRRDLLALISKLMGNLIERYRLLAEQGTVELSASPYSHPMLPLLLDLQSAREAQPDAELPESPCYPGGEERAIWQLARAREAFQDFFELEPAGCWPSEGGLSERTVALIGEAGFQWTASGQGVLRHSLEEPEPTGDDLHRPRRLQAGGPLCFFRDDGLSDLIGFTYQNWHARDAVADLIHHLRTIAGNKKARPGRVVSIILDGENPWEHYAQNGFYFLRQLYTDLADCPEVRLVHFSDCVKELEGQVDELPTLVAGSWVNGNFDTWIGNPDKNRAWDLLCQAKAAVDKTLPDIEDEERQAAVERQLAVCEGSDWFWWFGDYNPAGTVTEFDTLYRRQLVALYELLEQTPPDNLDNPIGHGSGQPEAGGTMRRGTQ